MKLYNILSYFVLLMIITMTTSAYSTYGAPSEFGNETTTTAWLGGDLGELNITGSAKIDGNVTGSSGLFSWLGSLGSRISNIFTNDLDVLDDVIIGDDLNVTGITRLTGSLYLDDNSGESPRIYFYNELNNESRIYEQTDGDLYIAAAKGFELAGTSFRLTTLTNCEFIKSDGTGILSCANSESSLNVNSSDYWDDYDSPSGWDLDSSDDILNNSDNGYFLFADEINFTTLKQKTDGIEWIKPEHVLDIDKADIEGDLNTFWDIAGDSDAGSYVFDFPNSNLTMGYYFGDGSQLTGIIGSSNSSDYWDALDSPSDINAGDIADDGTYRLNSWDNFTGIPTATPSNGDITHLSTANHIYDFVIALGYATQSWVNTQLGNYYNKTDINTQGKVETIWGVTLSTDSERTTGLAAQDACSEITGCVENAITDGNTNWDNSYGFIINTVSDLTNYYTKTIIDSLGNWTADKSSYWDTGTDLDTVISTDEITELKIDFNTACAAGNHLYVSGNNLACEADDDTTYLGGNGITLVGTTFNFDGGASPAGDLGGTWATPSVDDDSHNHIYSNIDATTSANWNTRVSDNTGTGAWVFGTSPTFTTGITVPANSISDDELDEGATFEWTNTHSFSNAITMGSGVNINFADTGTYIDGTATTMTIEPDDTLTINADTAINMDGNTLYVDASGNKVGIGTADPDFSLEIESDAAAWLGLSMHYNTGAFGPTIYFKRSKGTKASPTTVVSGDVLGDMSLKVYDGSTYWDTNGFQFISKGFKPLGAPLTAFGLKTSGTTALFIDENQSVGITSLEGTFSNGEAYVCVYDNGTIFAKDSACS